jgi:acyl carrier protein
LLERRGGVQSRARLPAEVNSRAIDLAAKIRHDEEIMASELTNNEKDCIRRNFKRCSPETIEAIIRFREGRDPSEVHGIACGIIRRYMAAEHAGLLDAATADTLLSDLRIESLTMMEIVLDMQDALDITISDAELRDFKTLGDVLGFLEKKVVAVS